MCALFGISLLRSDAEIEHAKSFAAKGVADGFVAQFSRISAEGDRLVVLHCSQEFLSEFVVWAEQRDGLILGGSYFPLKSASGEWSGAAFEAKGETAEKYNLSFEKCAAILAAHSRSPDRGSEKELKYSLDVYLGAKGKITHKTFWSVEGDSETGDLVAEALKLAKLFAENPKGSK